MTVGDALDRDRQRTKPARLAGLPHRRRWRGLPDELAVREFVRRPLLRPALRHPPSSAEPIPSGSKGTLIMPGTFRKHFPPDCTQCGMPPPPSGHVPAAGLQRRTSLADRGTGDCACAARAAVLLLEAVSVAHAQPDAERPPAAIAAADRIADFVEKLHSDSQFRRPGFEPSCRRKAAVRCVPCRPKAPWD